MSTEGSESEGADSVRHIIEVLAVQAARARAYHDLGRAMRENDAGVIEGTTEEFRELSRQVRALIDVCENGKSDRKCAAIAALSRRIQEDEAEKLRLTVEIHALKSSHILDEEDVGVGGEAACSCGTRAGPSKHDVAEALKEAIVAMEACVQRLLECMEELREMKLELTDG